MTYIIPEGMVMSAQIDLLVKTFMRKSPYRAFFKVEGSLHGRCARFQDVRFPHMDTLSSVYLDEGNLVVHSRLIDNERFASHSRGRNTLRSKKEDKALKNMLQYIKPYTMFDSWKNRIHRFGGYYIKWREGPKEPCISAFRSLSYTDFFAELLRVDVEGLPFSSPKFMHALAVGKESYNEARRRTLAKGNLHYVYYTDNGISVLTGDIRDPEKANEIKEYQNASEMPEVIQERVPLLKMMADNEHIDEIGFRVSENEFFVIELLESNVG